MKLIKEEFSEPIYTLEFTQSELFTVLVALGDTTFAKIVEVAKNEYHPNTNRVADSHNLYNDLLKLLQLSVR